MNAGGGGDRSNIISLSDRRAASADRHPDDTYKEMIAQMPARMMADASAVAEHRDRLVEEVEGLPDDLFLEGHRTHMVRVLINARCHVLIVTSCDWKDEALIT